MNYNKFKILLKLLNEIEFYNINIPNYTNNIPNSERQKLVKLFTILPIYKTYGSIEVCKQFFNKIPLEKVFKLPKCGYTYWNNNHQEYKLKNNVEIKTISFGNYSIVFKFQKIIKIKWCNNIEDYKLIKKNERNLKEQEIEQLINNNNNFNNIIGWDPGKICIGASSDKYKLNKNYYNHEIGLTKLNFIKKRNDKRNFNIKQIENSIISCKTSDYNDIIDSTFGLDFFNKYDLYNHYNNKKIKKLKFNHFIEKKKFWSNFEKKYKNKIIAFGCTNVFEFSTKKHSNSYKYIKHFEKNNIVI